MDDLSESYKLKVEFLEKNQSVDEEEEFRSFCMNLLGPDTTNDDNQPCSGENSKSESLSSPSSNESRKKIYVKNNRTTASAIKRVKPAYVQTLRPQSAHVSDDDIRLSYARTFFNTFNGLEKEDLDRKLVAYCVDDVTMSVKWLGEKGNPCGPSYREVQGLKNVTTYLVAILVTAVPDSVMQLQDSKLRVRPDKCSYLLCKYTFSGTQVGKIEPIKTPTANSILSNTSVSSNTDNTLEQILKKGRIGTDIITTATTTSISANTTVDTHIHNPMEMEGSANDNTHSNHSLGKRSVEISNAKLPHSSMPAPISTEMTGDAVLLPTVYKMNIVGTLIIHINANKKIHKFEYIQKVVKLVPCKNIGY